MLALAEYRKPKKGGAAPATEQVDVVRQQPENPGDFVRNGHATNGAKDETPVSALSGGVGSIEAVRESSKTVASKHGTSNGRGQGSLKPQRLEARRTQRRASRPETQDHGASANGTAASHEADELTWLQRPRL